MFDFVEDTNLHLHVRLCLSISGIIFPSLSRHRGRPPVRPAHPGWTQRGECGVNSELIFKLPGNTRLSSNCQELKHKHLGIKTVEIEQKLQEKWSSSLSFPRADLHTRRGVMFSSEILVLQNFRKTSQVKMERNPRCFWFKGLHVKIFLTCPLKCYFSPHSWYLLIFVHSGKNITSWW